MAWSASENNGRSNIDIEDTLQAPPAAYLGSSGFQPSKQPAGVTVESMEVEEPTYSRMVTLDPYYPQRLRLRRYPSLERQKWRITLSILTALTIAFCVLAIVYRLINQKDEYGRGGFRPLRAERTPFVCGTNPDHWSCTTRFAGPKAADMTSHAALIRWMNQHCVFQAPRGDFWMCGDGLGPDHGVPGGEGTWVEKVSDDMMQTRAVKHNS